MVNAGIIGLDNWYHAIPIAEYNEKHNMFSLAAVSSENSARLKEYAQRFAVNKTYSDWKDLIADRDLSAAIVCCATSKHMDPVLAALAAGKHVLCDKPMTISLSDAERIVAAVKKTDLFFGMVHNYRLSPEIIAGKELLAQGTIGKVSSLTYSCRKPLPEDWPGSGKRGWYAEPTLSGGGGFVDHAAHTLDVILWYLEGYQPTSVQACMKNLVWREFPGEDYGVAIIDFSDGVVAVAESSWTAPKNLGGPEYIQITGDQGEIYINRVGRPFIQVRKSGLGSGHTERIDVPEMVWTDIVNRIVGNFFAAIEGREGLFKDLGVREGRNVVQLIEAAYKSASTGAKVCL